MAEKKKPSVGRMELKSLPLQAIVEKMNAHYGANTLVMASKAKGLVKRFVSTGVNVLDYALGGGLIENRIIEIRGAYSTLKSTIVQVGMAKYLRKYKEGIGVYVDVEKTFDPFYAESLGVDTDRVLLVNPDSGEQAADVAIDLMDVGRPTYMGIDSIAAMTPTAELDASMDQQSMGLHPRLINKLMRCATARIKRNLYDSSAPTTTVVCLNQIREKIGVSFGSPETSPGGRGKEFAYSVIIRLYSSAGDALKEDITLNGIKRKIRFGQNVKFRVEKNKASGSQYEEGEFLYYIKPYKGHKVFSFNNAEASFDYGVYYGIIEARPVKVKDKGSSKTKLKTKYFYGDISYFDVPSFVKALEKDSSALRGLHREIVEAIVQEDVLVKGSEVPKVVVAV